MWRSRNDFGLEQIANLHEALRINDHWAVDIHRGFMWWPDEFAQSVWSDVGMFHNAQSVFRLHVETELIRGKGKVENLELALASEMSHASLSSICYEAEKDLFVLHSSLYVTADNIELLGKIFLATAALQAAEATSISHRLSTALRAVPAISAHPTHGLRSPVDPILGAVDMFFKPYSGAISKWVGIPEWQDIRRAMDREAAWFDSDRETWMKAGFPFGYGSTSELHIDTGKPHPVLGNGLAFELRVPVTLAPERAAHMAMELNHLERTEWLRAHMLGSWGFGDEHLVYECFVPNVVFHEGTMEHLALSMANRATWLNEYFANMQRHMES